jgi:hypothetical protein
MFKASTNVNQVADFYFSTTRIRLREGCVSANHDIDFLPIMGRPAVATYRSEKLTENSGPERSSSDYIAKKEREELRRRR